MGLSVDAVRKAKKVAQQPVSFERRWDRRRGTSRSLENIVLPSEAASDLDLTERMA